MWSVCYIKRVSLLGIESDKDPYELMKRIMKKNDKLLFALGNPQRLRQLLKENPNWWVDGEVPPPKKRPRPREEKTTKI